MSVQSSKARPQSARLAAELSQAGFQRVADLALQKAGLTIPSSKLGMIQSRLAKRLAATGYETFDQYLDFLFSGDGANELPQAISSLTTNVSQFFREAHHFETLRTQILPALVERARTGARVRIWSAGCSSGQEPLSIATELLEFAQDIAALDMRILATDIDHAILGRANAAIYTPQQVVDVPDGILKRYFVEEASGAAGYRAADDLLELIAYRKLNLIDPWPMKNRFDVIFCRNVVIYFSDDTQSALWPRFHAALAPDGWMFLGHSERLDDVAARSFVNAGVTTYRPASAAGS
ncbi:MAG: protein-glutamate O-methyltransferase [Rhodobacteraceae bacterium]|nr:protein-glutamate O-methyltransferase [Paracoccaceae bacterium]